MPQADSLSSTQSNIVTFPTRARPAFLAGRAAPLTVLMCREDGAGGLDLSLVGQDGAARTARLTEAQAASFRRVLAAITPAEV